MGSIAHDLARTFAWRHERTRRDLARLAPFAGAGPSLTIGITGATGLVGRQLAAFLANAGHRVLPIVRDPGCHPLPGAIAWYPAKGWIDAGGLAACDAVVHLAGETVAQRWSADARRRILASRVEGTGLLARTIARHPGRVAALVCASGINAYPFGDQVRRDDRDEPWGDAFLATVVRQWEGAADPVRLAGIRTVHLRIGMVLAADGGALQPQLLPFRLGLGGRLGSGRQWLSWIGLDDLVGMFHAAVVDPRWQGAIHAVGPRPATQADFAQVLGRILHRPAILPMPAAALRLALGQMADELILSGVAAEPVRAMALGFTFQDHTLGQALGFALGR